MAIGAVGGTVGYSSALNRITVTSRAKPVVAEETDVYESQNAAGAASTGEGTTSSGSTSASETKSSGKESSSGESSGGSKAGKGGSGEGAAAGGGGASGTYCDPADTNRDGIVSAEEARKYTNKHPDKAARYESAASTSTAYTSQGKVTSGTSGAGTLEVYA